MTTFTIPKDYKIPEDVKDGVEFQQLVTLKKNGDKLTLCSVGDALMDDDDYAEAVSKGFKNMKEQNGTP